MEVLSGFGMVLVGFQKDLKVFGGFQESPRAGGNRHRRISGPLKESLSSGKGSLCGQVSRVKVPGLTAKL